MNNSKIGGAIGTGVLAITCIVLGYVGSQILAKCGGAAAGKGDPRKLVAQVAVTNGEMRVYNLPETYVGWVEPIEEVQVVPEVEGCISEVNFKEGDIVKRGQLLYTIDDEKYSATVQQREADLKAAEAEYRRAKRYNDRMKSADDRGVTQLERDNAEAGEDTSAAAIHQAKANLTVAKYSLKRSRIYASIDGKIGKTNVHRGDYVAPSKGALAKIVRFDPIRVRFPITDRMAEQFNAEQKAGTLNNYRLKVVLPSDKLYDVNGTWDFGDNEISAATATLTMRAKFANPDQVLLPNAYVKVKVDSLKPPSYLCVPQQCVVDLSGGSMGVWVVGEDMSVMPRAVKTRESFNGWTPITEGLKAGERVVLSGVGKLMAGQKVTFAVPTSNDDINANHKSRIRED